MARLYFLRGKNMNIPDFLNRDDYLQNPIMRRFLKKHNLTNVARILPPLQEGH